MMFTQASCYARHQDIKGAGPYLHNMYALITVNPVNTANPLEFKNLLFCVRCGHEHQSRIMSNHTYEPKVRSMNTTSA